MLNYIWGFMIIISVICSIFTGRIEELSDSVLSGASCATELLISMFGMMALWTGLMKIANESGITEFLAKFFSKILKRLFPDYSENKKAMQAICLNIAANMLGLGNASTPLGIAAMKEMNKTNSDKSTANNSMAMFVVINTASIQIIPTMITILRQKHGSAAPFEVIPAIWVTSILVLTIGVAIAKILEKRN